MRSLGHCLGAALLFLACDCRAAAPASDLALSSKYPLTQVQSGQLLIAELNCSACHVGVPQSSLPKKTAPELADVGGRIAPEFLKQFLESPATVHSGTMMPDMLASKPAVERAEIAEALTHYLVDQSKSAFRGEVGDNVDPQVGKTLYHTVGCVACHGPRESIAEFAPANDRADALDEDDTERETPGSSIQPIAFSLAHVAAKYSVQSLSEFLFQPLHVRSSGRMPDMKLTRSESLALAAYLVGGQARHRPAVTPQESLAALGQKAFRDLNCAACHRHASIPAAPPVVSLASADLTRGCLSISTTRSPRFQLEESQVEAIKAALNAGLPMVDSDEVVAAKTLVAFNCIACHVRDDFGGVHDMHNPFFSTTEQKLGDDGRLPPPLTLIGAKLQPTWMKKVLFDGESVRPYMTTRMPQYGSANLKHLPDVFARLDVMQVREIEIPSPESRSERARQEEKVLRAAGRELLGDKGVNCIACHQFNGKPAVSNQGMDLITTYQRLQPGWFDAFLRNPGRFRPRIIMPTAWPEDQAAYKTILEGDTDRQITAIWYYLSLGTSAADPPGIRAVNTKLSVGDKARTYRGRSRVAGFRGIAVGLPERLSYAFNAETGTLCAIWRGDFIGVNRSGQGSGDFTPSGQPVTLAQDVSFAPLADEHSPWPLMPVMTKDARTNPDPLYPKNLGYQFRGYYHDQSAIPTFMYRSGAIDIEDRSSAIGSDDQQRLKRILCLESPSPQTVWFRALAGEIVQESERVYRSGRLRLTIPSAEATLRPLAGDTDRSELLLRLQLPRGKSTLEFIYEPLP